MKKLALLAVLGLGLPLWGAPAFVQSSNANCIVGGTSCTSSLTGVASGHLLTVGVEVNNSGATIAASDGSNGSYTSAVNTQNGNGWTDAILYFANTTSGNLTVTVSGCSCNYRVFFAEYSGVAISNALDCATGQNGNSANLDSGSCTATNGDLVFGYGFCLGGSCASGSGFTQRTTNDALNLAEDQVLSGTSADATATQSSNLWTMQVAAFKASGGAATIVPRQHKGWQ